MTIDGIEYLNPETINGLNLYAYCNNNPIMLADPNGHFGIGLTLLIATGVGLAFGLDGLLQLILLSYMNYYLEFK